jgi:hypothetical protein
MKIRRCLILATSVVSPLTALAAPFDHAHAIFDTVLRKHVSESWVDYGALKADPKPLDTYLDGLAAVSEEEFNRWSEKERLAFLLNLYNAATLKLVVDHYPIKSIKDIGGFRNGPWKQKVVRLFGKVIALDEVEHGLIRAQYHDPRVHFALVCAAKGCPPLRAEAYVAARLDDQLDHQGRVFLGQAHKNRVAAASRTVYLSPIFKWFKKDFEEKSGSVLRFVESYLPEKDRPAVAAGGFKIRYTAYDWSLNDKSQERSLSDGRKK